MTFEKGDRVRTNEKLDMFSAAKGAVATVTENWRGGTATLRVYWDASPLRNGQHHGGYGVDWFELIPAESAAGTNPKDLLGVQKPPLDLLPPAGQIYGSMAMRSGANKYGPYNWRDKPVQARIYIGAIARHALAYLDGEEVSADNGVHHFGAIIAGASILADARESGCLVDDRPKKGTAGALIDRISAAIKSAGGDPEAEVSALAAVFNTPTCEVTGE